MTDKIYPVKQAANVKGYYSEDLKGVYKDKYGNNIYASMLDDDVYIDYEVKLTKDNLPDLKQDLEDNTFFTENSKDGKSKYYTTFNGRFRIVLTKKTLEWDYIVKENHKNSILLYCEAMRGDPGVLYVNSYTNFTNITIKKGDKIYIHASEKVTIDDIGRPVGPEGRAWNNYQNIMPAINFGALMVKVNGADWVATGENMIYIAPVSGRLRFTINDKDPTDNEGNFTVEYGINKKLNYDFTPKPAKVAEPVKPTPAPVTVAAPTPVPVATALKTSLEYNVKPYLPKRFNGTISNVTAFASSGCTMTMSMNSDGTYRLVGATDNINLTGKWDLTGTEVTDATKKTYQFSGYMDLGYPGSGLPAGTKTQMNMQAEITDRGMTGTYSIAPFLNFNYIQKGTLNLK